MSALSRLNARLFAPPRSGGGVTDAGGGRNNRQVCVSNASETAEWPAGNAHRMREEDGAA